jgi:hypothetical protein
MSACRKFVRTFAEMRCLTAIPSLAPSRALLAFETVSVGELRRRSLRSANSEEEPDLSTNASRTAFGESAAAVFDAWPRKGRRNSYLRSVAAALLSSFASCRLLWSSAVEHISFQLHPAQVCVGHLKPKFQPFRSILEQGCRTQRIAYSEVRAIGEDEARAGAL